MRGSMTCFHFRPRSSRSKTRSTDGGRISTDASKALRFMALLLATPIPLVGRFDLSPALSLPLTVSGWSFRPEISLRETTSRTPLVEATRRDLDQTVRQAALCGTPVHFGKALQARHRRTNKEGSFRVGDLRPRLRSWEHE